MRKVTSPANTASDRAQSPALRSTDRIKGQTLRVKPDYRSARDIARRMVTFRASVTIPWCMNATDLLTEFRKHCSEAAFAELIRRYTPLVYSAAWRRLSNVAQAQEVTQTVFIRLAQATPRLPSDAAILAWLHRTTVHVSIDLWRSEARRRAREEQAAAMHLNLNDPDPRTADWTELAPALDDALNQLPTADRQALLLRYFDRQSMRALGETLGVTEDAAKMRVSRALDRLRARLAARGLACGAVALEGLLADRSVEAAPAAVVAMLAGLPVPAPTGLAGLSHALATIVSSTGAKLATGIVGAGLLAVVAWQFFDLRPVQPRVKGRLTPQELPPATATTVVLPGASTARAAMEDAPANPDPLALLEGVAAARYRFASGSLELRVVRQHHRPDRTEETEERLAIQFDGTKRRFEMTAREYRYAYDPVETRQEAIRAQADALSREAAVAAGLLEPFEARRITIYDGSALLQYSEVDGGSEGTQITDPGRGLADYVFDPRCLGLSPSLSIEESIEDCLGFRGAKSLRTVGQEAIDGIPAWHLEVVTAYDEVRQIWIPVARPKRVVKVAGGWGECLAQYHDAESDPALPVSVTRRSFRNGTLDFEWQIRRANTHLDDTIDPETFTLAGLGMAVGTPVADVRLRRRIGYWTGSGLAEALPKPTPEPTPPPSQADLRKRMTADPTSPEARDAAVWVLLNTPDGALVEEAADVLYRLHLWDTNLAPLCQELLRTRPKCATNLLEGLLMVNPSTEIRGMACFALAELSKYRAAFGANQEATTLAEQLFERVTTDFGNVQHQGRRLAEIARPELSELRRLSLGMTAPEIVGIDLDGRPMRLSQFRGRVVVLVFWTASMVSDLAEHQTLFAPFADRAFVWVGVNGDRNPSRTKEARQASGLLWPSFADGRDGPIAKDWNVTSWLTTYVLDARGVIRHRDLRGRDLADSVRALLDAP